MGLGLLAAGIAVGLSVLGGALANAKIIATALEGMARQPEQSSVLRSTMIIGAALVEGLAILAIVIAILIINKV